MLRDDFAQHHLLREILGPDHQWLFRCLCATSADQRQRGQQHADTYAASFRSIHPSPPSDISAIRAAGTAPARICTVSTDATPRKMKTPSPPPPIAAAMVAVPMVVTVAMRTPAIMVGAGSGSSTSPSHCRPV